MASLWRQAFDAVERPVAAALDVWVRSEAFMDLATVGFRLQRRMMRDVRRVSEQWLHAYGVSSQADLARLMNQVGSLERQLRDLRRDMPWREAPEELSQTARRRSA